MDATVSEGLIISVQHFLIKNKANNPVTEKTSIKSPIRRVCFFYIKGPPFFHMLSMGFSSDELVKYIP